MRVVTLSFVCTNMDSESDDTDNYNYEMKVDNNDNKRRETRIVNQNSHRKSK